MSQFFDIKNTGPLLGNIPTWSHSRLKTFETCNHALERQVVLKETYFDDEAPAAIHGQAVHAACENYIQHNTDEIGFEFENTNIAGVLDRLREKYLLDLVDVEQKWGFDVDWKETGYFDKDIWGRVIIDALEWEDTEHRVAKCIDWKSGKGSDTAKFKYADQMNTYAISSFMRHKNLEFIETQLQFTDKAFPPLIQRYTRDQAMKLFPVLNKRLLKLTTATFFPPNPSKQNCRFCDHAKHETCDFRWEE